MSEGGANRKQPKACDRCGHLLIYTTDMWQRMGHREEHPLRHVSERVRCGGKFVSLAATLGRAS